MTTPTKQDALEALDRLRLDALGVNCYKADADVFMDDRVIRDYINGGGWQPIETAPKDGRHCLISIEGLSRSFLAVYNGEAWNTIDARANWTGRKVTHWMPLPTAPEREE